MSTSVSADEKTRIHDLILAGRCPFCDTKKVFANVAIHVNKVHDIHHRDLRDMAGFTASDRICDSGLSDKLRTHAVENKVWERVDHTGWRGKIRRGEVGEANIVRALKQRMQTVAESRVPRHGTVYEYSKFKCRCAACRTAAAKAARRTRSRKRGVAVSNPRFDVPGMSADAIEQMEKKVKDLVETGEAWSLRTKAGMRQIDVARHCGVAGSAICKWEKGTTSPRGMAALLYEQLLNSLRQEGHD